MSDLQKKWKSVIEYGKNHSCYYGDSGEKALSLLLEKIEKFLRLYKGIEDSEIICRFIDYAKSGRMSNEDFNKVIAINYFDKEDTKIRTIKFEGVD